MKDAKGKHIYESYEENKDFYKRLEDIINNRFKDYSGKDYKFKSKRWHKRKFINDDKFRLCGFIRDIFQPTLNDDKLIVGEWFSYVGFVINLFGHKLKRINGSNLIGFIIREDLLEQWCKEREDIIHTVAGFKYDKSKF